MKQSRYTFNFCIKSSRKNSEGRVPIYFRLTIGHDRKERAVNLSVDPQKWNAKLGMCTGRDAYSQALNTRLNTIRTKVLESYVELSLKTKPTAQHVINHYLGNVISEKEEQKITLMSLFRSHNKKFEELVKSGQNAPETLERYKTTYKHTLQFLMHEYKTGDVDFFRVDEDFISEFDHFLRTVRNCAHNTTVKYMKNFRKIILIAMRKKLLQEDPFENYNMKLVEVVPEFLEIDELKRIMEKKFASDRLTQVRDAFVFCCFTGLAFSDIKTLSRTHISNDNDTTQWIRKKRQKTKIPFNVPLLKAAVVILDKYKDKVKGGYCIPVLSNQKMNEYLKEIAVVCNVNKNLTTHVARHTFATVVCLANGVSLENVSKMLGHTNISMTEHYAKVLDRSIKSDMTEVNDALMNFGISEHI